MGTYAPSSMPPPVRMGRRPQFMEPLLSVPVRDDHHRAGRVLHHLAADRPEGQPREPAIIPIIRHKVRMQVIGMEDRERLNLRRQGRHAQEK